MGRIYNTQLPTGSGMAQLIQGASQSPLKPLSEAMSNISSILDNRAKDQYTKSALEKLKGVKTTQDYLDVTSTLDPTMLSKEGILAFDRRGKDIQAGELLDLKQQQQQLGLDKLAEINRHNLATEGVTKDTTPTDIKEMITLGYPLTKEGYKQFVNAKTTSKSSTPVAIVGEDNKPIFVTPTEAIGKTPWKPKTKEDSLTMQKKATNEFNVAEARWKQNPTLENKKAMEQARSIMIKQISTGTESAESSDLAFLKQARENANLVLKGKAKWEPITAYDTENKYITSAIYKNDKVAQKHHQTLSDGILGLESSKRIYGMLEKAIKSGNYKTGIIDTSLAKIGGMTPKSFRDFVGLDSTSIKTQLGLEGEIGDEVALYLKSLSGATATEQEFARTLFNSIGSDWMQEDIRQDKFRRFIAKKQANYENIAKSLYSKGLQSTAGKFLYGENGVETIKKMNKAMDDYKARLKNGTIPQGTTFKEHMQVMEILKSQGGKQ